MLFPNQTELIASRTLSWYDVDKFTFIWNNDLVIVHSDINRRMETIISNHDTEVLENIHSWLGNTLDRGNNPFRTEDEFEKDYERDNN